MPNREDLPMSNGSSVLGLGLGLVVSILAGGLAGYESARQYKPAPVIVQPQTNFMGTKKEGVASRTEQRRVAMTWGELDQREIDALTKLLDPMPHQPVTIFCEEDSKCGDLQLDFDNAFESAHWDTKLERPLIDDTVGIATSSPELMKAINDATNGRLAVHLIPKNAPFVALAIGKKPQ
jgi:hypothetical protein